MKRTLSVVLCIALMLFSFASCSNDSSGPVFTGNAQNVAAALDPVALVEKVLSGKDDPTIDISYEFIAQEKGAKALDAGLYILRAEVRFNSYETEAGIIKRGSLVYEMPGRVVNGTFTVSGSCSISTEAELIVETADGNAPVVITDESAKVTGSATMDEEGKINASVSVSASLSISAEFNGTPVEIEDDTTPSHDTTPTPAPDPSTEYDVDTAEEFSAMLTSEGQVRLTGKNIEIQSLEFPEDKEEPIIIDLNGNTLTIAATEATVIPESISVKISDGNLDVAKGIVLSAVSSVELDGVKYSSQATGFSLGTSTISATGATLTIKNSSEIIANAEYAIATYATAGTDTFLTETVTIMIENSTVTATAADGTGSSCAVWMNIPGTLTITDSTITGDRQGLSLQGGTATITGGSIISIGNYSGDKYYIDEDWTSGTDAPFAALLVGNKVTTKKTDVTCTLADTMIDMKKSEIDGAYDIFVYGSGIEENYVSVAGNVSNTRDELKVNDDSMHVAGWFLNTKPREEPDLKGTFDDYVSSKLAEYPSLSEEGVVVNLLGMLHESFYLNYLEDYSAGTLVPDNPYPLEDVKMIGVDSDICYWGTYTILGETIPSDSYSVLGRISIDDFVFDIEGSVSDAETGNVTITDVEGPQSYELDSADLDM